MKKFIKDWWPLLVIVAVVVLKKKFLPNKSLHVSQNLEQRLINAGFTTGDIPCPECGGKLYVKGYSSSDPNVLSFNLVQYCTTPGCGYCLPENKILL